MMLSEVPFEELKIGDHVISKLGTPGTITDLIPIHLSYKQEDNGIFIYWDNGNMSCPWHFQSDGIIYNKLANLCLRNS